MRPILALLLLTTPALAQDALDHKALAQPGAVALYVQASQLYTLGQQAKDPLTVTTAARLLRGLTLTDTPRVQHIPTPLQPLDPVKLLHVARSLDAGDTYTDLIEQVASDLPAKPKSVAATASTLTPGSSETWTLSFYGGTYAELAILGDGKSNLDLSVTDASGAPICLDLGSADTAQCGFTLRDNGNVTVTVTNAGTVANTYTLLTN
ncbi:MAG: hypothetical protein H7317_17415 [Pseudorhodobacter sp.]|nr:hypothetical protein [Pseudorhodobacter sp.]